MCCRPPAQVDTLLQAISPNDSSALVRKSIIDFVQALVKKAFAGYGDVRTPAPMHDAWHAAKL